MAHLLIVEDDELVRKMASMVLVTAGHTVVEAENGDDALAKLASGGVDLVLTDIVMPRKEGVETIREIRTQCPNVKIVAMSGSPSYDLYLRAARQLGADEVLKKPFRPDDLRATVARVLSGR